MLTETHMEKLKKAGLQDYISSAAEIIDEARAGRIFILVDDEDRENEGDLVIPADFKGRQPYPGVDVPRATIVNVTNLYQRLGRAILEGAELEPSFATGVEMHQLIDLIEQAQETGSYQESSYFF